LPFTVRDLEDLLRLLQEHPEWRRELLQALLTEDFLRLPEAFQEVSQRLADATAAIDRTGRRLEEISLQLQQLTVRVNDLAAQLQQLTARVDDLTAQVQQLTVRMNDLTARVDDLTVRLEQLTARVDDLAAQVQQLTQTLQAFMETTDRRFRRLEALIADVRGSTTEDRMRTFFYQFLADRGLRRLTPIRALHLNALGEIDGVVQVETPTGERLWVLIEAKVKLYPKDVRQFARRLRRPHVREKLHHFGIRGKALVWVFGLGLTMGVEEVAEKEAVGLVEAHIGEIVPPQVWDIGCLSPYRSRP